MKLRCAMAIGATLAVSFVGLSACSQRPDEQGVASAQSESPRALSPGRASGTASAHEFAACLRARGLDVEDPPPGEQVRLESKDEKTRAALSACAQFAPSTSSESEDAFDPVAGRAYAACIRTKGFPDFPDPDDQGLRIPKSLVNDSRYAQANRECASHLNQSTGGTK